MSHEETRRPRCRWTKTDCTSSHQNSTHPFGGRKLVTSSGDRKLSTDENQNRYFNANDDTGVEMTHRYVSGDNANKMQNKNPRRSPGVSKVSESGSHNGMERKQLRTQRKQSPSDRNQISCSTNESNVCKATLSQRSENTSSSSRQSKDNKSAAETKGTKMYKVCSGKFTPYRQYVHPEADNDEQNDMKSETTTSYYRQSTFEKKSPKEPMYYTIRNRSLRSISPNPPKMEENSSETNIDDASQSLIAMPSKPKVQLSTTDTHRTPSKESCDTASVPSGKAWGDSTTSLHSHSRHRRSSIRLIDHLQMKETYEGLGQRRSPEREVKTVGKESSFQNCNYFSNSDINSGRLESRVQSNNEKSCSRSTTGKFTGDKDCPPTLHDDSKQNVHNRGSECVVIEYPSEAAGGFRGNSKSEAAKTCHDSSTEEYCTYDDDISHTDTAVSSNSFCRCHISQGSDTLCGQYNEYQNDDPDQSELEHQTNQIHSIENCMNVPRETGQVSDGRSLDSDYGLSLDDISRSHDLLVRECDRCHQTFNLMDDGQQHKLETYRETIDNDEGLNKSLNSKNSRPTSATVKEKSAVVNVRNYIDFETTHAGHNNTQLQQVKQLNSSQCDSECSKLDEESIQNNYCHTQAIPYIGNAQEVDDCPGNFTNKGRRNSVDSGNGRASRHQSHKKSSEPTKTDKIESITKQKIDGLGKKTRKEKSSSCSVLPEHQFSTASNTSTPKSRPQTKFSRKEISSHYSRDYTSSAWGKALTAPKENETFGATSSQGSNSFNKSLDMPSISLPFSSEHRREWKQVQQEQKDQQRQQQNHEEQQRSQSNRQYDPNSPSPEENSSRFFNKFRTRSHHEKSEHCPLPYSQCHNFVQPKKRQGFSNQRNHQLTPFTPNHLIDTSNDFLSPTNSNQTSSQSEEDIGIENGNVSSVSNTDLPQERYGPHPDFIPINKNDCRRSQSTERFYEMIQAVKKRLLDHISQELPEADANASNIAINSKAVSSFLTDYLISLWENQWLCDVLVRVEGQEVLAHKLILAAFSDVFCPNDPHPPPSVSFDIPDSTFEAVEQIFRYMYTGSMDLTDELLEPVLTAALYMGVSEVICLVQDIMKCADTTNIQMYMDIARSNSISYDIAKTPAIRHELSELLESGFFTTITEDELLDILDDPDVEVESEEVTLRAVIDWALSHPENNLNETIPRLLKKITLESIPPQTLTTFMEDFPSIFVIPEVMEIMLGIFQYHATNCEKERRAMLECNERERQRQSVTKKLQNKSYLEAAADKCKNILGMGKYGDKPDLTIRQRPSVSKYKLSEMDQDRCKNLQSKYGNLSSPPKTGQRSFAPYGIEPTVRKDRDSLDSIGRKSLPIVCQDPLTRMSSRNPQPSYPESNRISTINSHHLNRVRFSSNNNSDSLPVQDDTPPKARKVKRGSLACNDWYRSHNNNNSVWQPARNDAQPLYRNRDMSSNMITSENYSLSSSSSPLSSSEIPSSKAGAMRNHLKIVDVHSKDNIAMSQISKNQNNPQENDVSRNLFTITRTRIDPCQNASTCSTDNPKQKSRAMLSDVEIREFDPIRPASESSESDDGDDAQDVDSEGDQRDVDCTFEIDEAGCPIIPTTDSYFLDTTDQSILTLPPNDHDNSRFCATELWPPGQGSNPRYDVVGGRSVTPNRFASREVGTVSSISPRTSRSLSFLGHDDRTSAFKQYSHY